MSALSSPSRFDLLSSIFKSNMPEVENAPSQRFSEDQPRIVLPRSPDEIIPPTFDYISPIIAPLLEHSPSKIEQCPSRKVLFVCPPNLSAEEAAQSCRVAFKEHLIKPDDHLVLVWAPSPGLNNTVSSESQSFTVGESTSPECKIIRVFANQYQEVAKSLSDLDPALHRFLEESQVQEREFEIHIHADAPMSKALSSEIANCDAIVIPSSALLNVEHLLLRETHVPVIIIQHP